MAPGTASSFCELGLTPAASGHWTRGHVQLTFCFWVAPPVASPLNLNSVGFGCEFSHCPWCGTQKCAVGPGLAQGWTSVHLLCPASHNPHHPVQHVQTSFGPVRGVACLLSICRLLSLRTRHHSLGRRLGCGVAVTLVGPHVCLAQWPHVRCLSYMVLCEKGV